MKTAQELVDSGLTGTALSDAIWEMFKAKFPPKKLPGDQIDFSLPEKEHRAFLDQIVTVTVWHGTRRREPIEDLKRYGFCSYTQEQAIHWLDEAHRRLLAKTKAGPRVTKRLEKWKTSTLWHVKEPWRGYFSVTGIEEDACGESPHDIFTADSENLLSGWADRNPEFVYDYLMVRASPQELDQILTEMFGKPIKVKLRVKIQLGQLLNPQDMHLKQRCFSPSEIISIEPCPPKTAKQLKAEVDMMWVPSVVPLAKKTGREGRCYEFALKHIIKQGEGTLIHGLVRSENLGIMIDHAWVVTEPGFVYEPVTNQYYDKKWIYETYNIQEVNTYTPEEAMIMAVRTHKFGPWSEEDRRKWLHLAHIGKKAPLVIKEDTLLKHTKVPPSAF